ncbi:Mitotic spindle assembly checkpoint protein MAD2A [Myotis davidii]|uniref:Mitotic spindle assembly checkpoint protein MAD2A n=1 Tax=Myotis davidii TaxID=225400 RepID=L5M5U9_MYODS|nr:Mitotic spindle assembly checkpoint protein MAD2A [Myotis davidii]
MRPAPTHGAGPKAAEESALRCALRSTALVTHPGGPSDLCLLLPQFQCDKTAKDKRTLKEMSQKAIQDEICSVIKQITATVTFLPLLEISYSFDLLIYTDKDLVVPEKWEELGPQFINNCEQVRLHSFSTAIHKVNSMVAYKRLSTTGYETKQ